MKKILYLFAVIFSLMTFSLKAQDAQKIAVSAYVAENCGVPVNSQSILESKLTQLLTSCGFAGEQNQRFILTAKVDILSEDFTDTAPVMHVYTLSFNLFIGDGYDGTLFSSASIEAKGVGNTKDKAYMQALKSVSPRDPALKRFVEEGKQKIIDYYVMNCSAIIQSAQTLAANQQFDEAMWQLSSIPDVCSDCYSQAMKLMASIYQRQVDQDGDVMLAEARNLWNAGQDRAAADPAGAILARINPQSKAYKEAQALSKTIAARVKAIDNREWNFQMQQYNDQIHMEKAALKAARDIELAQTRAARDIGVAWAKNQPKTIYKIYWW